MSALLDAGRHTPTQRKVWALAAPMILSNLSVPLVVRLEGTNVEQGKDILANSGLPIVAADDLGDAARKIVAEVKQAA